MLNATDGTEDLGIHVTAADEVTVYGLNREQFTTDAHLGLPTDILGNDYLIMAWKNVQILNGTEFAVVGTQDDTTVTITPSVTTGSHTAGTAYTVGLNMGQTYQLIASEADADLTGTIVSSDKPVAVYGGHQCANIPNGNTFACDHVEEELPPTSTWGKSFVTEPLATRLNGDTFRILASADNTQVSIDGTQVATLNRGEFHEQLIDGASVITTDKPVLVAQYSNGSTFDNVTSDPFMMLIPPYEQFLSSYTVTTPATGFSDNYINLVVPSAGAAGARVDGLPVPDGEFSPIGSSGFSGAQIRVDLGTHVLEGTVPFGAFMYGFDSFDSYGYPGGLSLAPIASVAQVTLSPKSGTKEVGSSDCITALVTDDRENPLAGIRVDFTVSGVNTDVGFVTTNGSGTADFCYTGRNPGDDTISAAVGTVSDTASRSWIVVPRPIGATPFRVPLVPAYAQCVGGNRQHGPPMSFSSCAPPQQASGQLTVGTSQPKRSAGELGRRGAVRRGGRQSGDACQRGRRAGNDVADGRAKPEQPLRLHRPAAGQPRRSDHRPP